MWSNAPGAVVRGRPRSRPGAAVADNIFLTQVVFIQLCLFAMHVGMHATMSLGNFHILSYVCVVVALPACFWDAGYHFATV